jgi:tRNA(fMet)-specific endonuclease VapC
VSFLLDTNICSAHLKRPSSLAHRMMQHSGRLGVSTVTIAELYAWIHRSQDPVRREALLLEFLVDTQVYSFDQDCAEVFGRIRAVLLAQGISVPGLDLQIASTALAHDLTLVTHNVADFQNNPNLRVVDWLES